MTKLEPGKCQCLKGKDSKGRNGKIRPEVQGNLGKADLMLDDPPERNYRRSNIELINLFLKWRSVALNLF